ncbi:putative nuclease HARBI1 isoform X1 [Gymnodraco acuticeps]|uniref:Nuclease HARBI1 isoform X1 n=1 Tax=Gymnodraco acuticeps TaxID=8218 RepID=A0A6P8VXR6_GYMAC|nr:putative nuclease HARBI1 isoform X1 [Gymnodraco acuticeps]
MAEIALAFFVADEVDAIEIPHVLYGEWHDEHRLRRSVPKVQQFVEEVVPQYSPSDFKSHFRLSRGHVEDVMTTIGPFYWNRQHSKVPLQNSVLACLWTLSNQESYRGVADRFNITKSTVCLHLHEFCSLVTTYLSHHISWPTGQALHNSELGFRAAGFPNTVCAVDGCHIPIVKPHCENPVAYINRKQFYSVVLTGFCDSKRRFCHVNVGHPGSWHDARAFRLSAVGRLLDEDPQSLVPEGMHIIGDSAYPLLPQLMRPYRDNGHLTARQCRFNQKLNVARVVIEHTFGLLKTKFRRLKCLYMKNIANISTAVTACCILHNMCLEEGEAIEVDEQVEAADNRAPHPQNQDAVLHRNQICDLF